MSVYEPKHIAKQFIERSIKNRKIITELMQENNVAEGYYEVTDKINTLFGFVLFPVECFNANKRKTTEILEDIDKDNNYIKEFKEFFKKIQSNHRYGSQNAEKIYKNIDSWTTESIWEILKCIRHCLAHSGKNGVTFLPLGNLGDPDKIKSILLYNYDKKIGRKFVIELMIEGVNGSKSELDELIELLIKFLVMLGDHHFIKKDNQENNLNGYSEDLRNHAMNYLKKIKNQQ